MVRELILLRGRLPSMSVVHTSSVGGPNDAIVRMSGETGTHKGGYSLILKLRLDFNGGLRSHPFANKGNSGYSRPARGCFRGSFPSILCPLRGDLHWWGDLLNFGLIRSPSKVTSHSEWSVLVRSMRYGGPGRLTVRGLGELAAATLREGRLPLRCVRVGTIPASDSSRSGMGQRQGAAVWRSLT